MRRGDTDPEVLKQRAPETPHWPLYAPILIAVCTAIATTALQWGVINTTLTNQQQKLGLVESTQAAQATKLSELDGRTTSLTARVGSYDQQDIPSHLTALDKLTATLVAQQADQKAQSAVAHDERVAWQNAVTLKIDALIAAVSKIEGRQDRKAEK